MRHFVFIVCLLLSAVPCYCQHNVSLADSIRVKYRMPELCYAVVSADSVIEMYALGERKIHSGSTATLNDRFRIGSNTKAITSFIAARLVKQGKISWDTKFFDLFPELKAGSRKEYHDLTLLNLLSFRTRLFPYTYTYSKPAKGQFTGGEERQRYQFAEWFFQQKPVPAKDSINFSNLGYVAAGLMLEKASGKSYKQLVTQLGEQLGIAFGFGQPNAKDPLQTWGHDNRLTPEPPGDDYKLNWLLAAGNINVSLPDYAKFIQLQLKGLKGRSPLLTKEEFHFLHFGLSGVSVGWFSDVTAKGAQYSYNIGNPGSFLTMVYIHPKEDLAFIFFTNVQTEKAEEGLATLYDELKKKYGVY
jgi:CubicO group peptidase (beta-lactamase class C family)